MGLGIRLSEPDPFDEPSQYGTAFTARYPGECSVCGDWFHEGDTIFADGPSGHVCEECVE